MDDFEAEVRAIGKGLFAAGACRHPGLYRGLCGAIFKPIVANAELRNGMFRFVDVLPQLGDGDDVAVHLQAYLTGVSLPGWQSISLDLISRVRLGWAVQPLVRRMAWRFIVVKNGRALSRVIRRLARVTAGTRPMR